MSSYNFSKIYSEKLMKVVSKIVLKKRFPKNGYSYNLKCFGLGIDFSVNFVKDVLKSGFKGECSRKDIVIPIFINGSYRQDLEEIHSILIHELTHCYQANFSQSCFDWDDEEEWIERECEQEAIGNEFKFDLEKGKDFYELIKIGNYKKLYDINPQLLENIKKGC